MRVKTLCVSLTMAAALGSPTSAFAHDPPMVDEREENSLTGFALHSVFGVALDNGALAMSLGGRYAWSNNWLVGIDAEYNPWFNLSFHDNYHVNPTNYLILPSIVTPVCINFI